MDTITLYANDDNEDAQSSCSVETTLVVPTRAAISEDMAETSGAAEVSPPSCLKRKRKGRKHKAKKKDKKNKRKHRKRRRSPSHDKHNQDGCLNKPHKSPKSGRSKKHQASDVAVTLRQPEPVSSHRRRDRRRSPVVLNPEINQGGSLIPTIPSTSKPVSLPDGYNFEKEKWIASSSSRQSRPIYTTYIRTRRAPMESKATPPPIVSSIFRSKALQHSYAAQEKKSIERKTKAKIVHSYLEQCNLYRKLFRQLDIKSSQGADLKTFRIPRVKGNCEKASQVYRHRGPQLHSPEQENPVAVGRAGARYPLNDDEQQPTDSSSELEFFNSSVGTPSSSLLRHRDGWETDSGSGIRNLNSPQPLELLTATMEDKGYVTSDSDGDIDNPELDNARFSSSSTDTSAEVELPNGRGDAHDVEDDQDILVIDIPNDDHLPVPEELIGADPIHVPDQNY